MQLAQALKPEQQAAELVLPTNHPFDGAEPFFEDGGIEQRLAASLGRFPASGIGVDVGIMPRLKIAFRLSRQLTHLSGFVLGGGRDARIAVNHAFIVHHKYASKKPNFVNDVPMMQIS